MEEVHAVSPFPVGGPGRNVAAPACRLMARPPLLLRSWTVRVQVATHPIRQASIPTLTYGKTDRQTFPVPGKQGQGRFLLDCSGSLVSIDVCLGLPSWFSAATQAGPGNLPGCPGSVHRAGLIARPTRRNAALPRKDLSAYIRQLNCSRSCRQATEQMASQRLALTLAPCNCHTHWVKDLNTQQPTRNVQSPRKSDGSWEFLVGYWTFNCSI